MKLFFVLWFAFVGLLTLTLAGGALWIILHFALKFW